MSSGLLVRMIMAPSSGRGSTVALERGPTTVLPGGTGRGGCCCCSSSYLTGATFPAPGWAAGSGWLSSARSLRLRIRVAVGRFGRQVVLLRVEEDRGLKVIRDRPVKNVALRTCFVPGGPGPRRRRGYPRRPGSRRPGSRQSRRRGCHRRPGSRLSRRPGSHPLETATLEAAALEAALAAVLATARASPVERRPVVAGRGGCAALNGVEGLLHQGRVEAVDRDHLDRLRRVLGRVVQVIDQQLDLARTAAGCS